LQAAWMHRRTDVDYNAWWMCLITPTIAQDMGSRCHCSANGEPDRVRCRSARSVGPRSLGIENRLHWVHDVNYAEDHSQVFTAHGLHVMAALH
jgi:galactofuranosylgalactofuranosylrhamnosyl-N-acetylglucosaminyl-diphospho-decaprenol beta-1,5/1,6-galactofuranosyltransferase